MSEAYLRRKVLLYLKPLHAIPVENPIHPGTPDVNYVGGWIELKFIKSWRKNADVSPVLLKHFTSAQRMWLRKRNEMGGRSFVLLQIQNDYYLFKGDVASKHLGFVTRPMLNDLAYKYWLKKLNKKEFIECLLN